MVRCIIQWLSTIRHTILSNNSLKSTNIGVFEFCLSFICFEMHFRRISWFGLAHLTFSPSFSTKNKFKQPLHTLWQQMWFEKVFFSQLVSNKKKLLYIRRRRKKCDFFVQPLECILGENDKCILYPD